MRESIIHASLRALLMAFSVVVGLALGFMALTFLFGMSSSKTVDQSSLTTVHTEEILPNADGERKVVSATAPVILQINIDGVIGVENLTDPKIRQILVESREGDYKDDRVKGVLLYINSPGGTVSDADGIYRELKRYKEKYNVPVYAYIDGLSASGAVYISLAADRIYASDASLVGSVGVILPTFMNVTKLLEKFGVDTLTISAGKDKDALNPLRPWTADEGSNYKDIVEFYYQRFVNLVTENRPIDRNKLINEYGAKVFPAEIAKAYGYIDESNASIEEALRELVKAAGLENEAYQVIKLENKNWFKTLFAEGNIPSVLKGKIVHQISINPEMDLMMQNKVLYLYTR